MACTRSANVSGLGSDLDIALAKLSSPALAERGLPIYMYVALLQLPKEAYLYNWFTRDGATFSIMVSALNIALTRRIFICQVQMDKTTTDAEKKKLLAFRESAPCFQRFNVQRLWSY